MRHERSFVASRPGQGRHGGPFHYVSPNSDLLGWILERVSGRRLVDLMSELLWAPMGAEFDAYVTVDRLGAPRTAGGLCVTLRDLGRVVTEIGVAVVKPAEFVIFRISQWAGPGS